MTRTRVRGVAELNRKIAQMPEAIKAAVREALAESAEELVGMMKRLVPVESGDLRDSIGWTFGNAPSGSVRIGGFSIGGLTVGGVTSSKAEEGLQVTIYAGGGKAFYARFVEHGTEAGTRGGRASYSGQNQSRRGRLQRRTHPGTAARPFFFVAYRAMRRRIRGRITRAMNKAIKRFVNG